MNLCSNSIVDRTTDDHTSLLYMTNDQLDQLAIQADMFCSQVATNCDIGDSAFNTDLYPDLMGDDYADAVLASL